MAALDFPNSPVVGQSFSAAGGQTWTWDGTLWLLGPGTTTFVDGPGGFVGQAVMTTPSPMALFTTAQALMIPLSVPVVAGRYYRLTGFLRALIGAAGAGQSYVTTQLYADGAFLGDAYSDVRQTYYSQHLHTYLWRAPTTKTVSFTWNGSANLAGGALVATTYTDSTSQFTVEDITPLVRGAASSGGGGGSDGFSWAQDTAPTATKHGQTWFDTSSGLAYIWVVDVNSAQWVQFAPGSGGAPTFAMAVGEVAGNAGLTASTWNAITFAANQTIRDPSVISIDGSNTQLTARRSGDYLVSFNASFATTTLYAGSQFVEVQIYVSGATTSIIDAIGGLMHTYTTMSGSKVIALTPGQFVSMRVYPSAVGVSILGDLTGRSFLQMSTA